MAFARVLRKEQTETEVLVWEALRDRRFLGLKFRRQHIIKEYVVDFYCRKHKLAIEIDGKIHEHQEDYDSNRQAEIESAGVTMIRISNTEVKKDITILLKKIGFYV